MVNPTKILTTNPSGKYPSNPTQSQSSTPRRYFRGVASFAEMIAMQKNLVPGKNLEEIQPLVRQ